MSDYAVIHGEHTGDWALVADGEWLTLYPPRTWHDYGDLPGYFRGLSWYPQSGIHLPRHPRLAWWKAHRIVAKRERAARRAAARRARTHTFITSRSKETP